MLYFFEWKFKRMNQKTKTERPSINSMRGWLNICAGLIICLLSLVAATSKTPVGAFLVYCLSFAFGMFYPLFLALIFFFGLYLFIERRAFSLKGKWMILLGFVFIIAAGLCFGSYGIYTIKDGGVDFTSLNTVYMDRMNSFAHDVWNIDSFESLSGLGGGYVGLFLTTLLGSIWGGIGDAIFFSCLLFVGLFFFLFKPTVEVVEYFSEKRKHRVNYSSPYRPRKDKSNPHLNRVLAEEQPKPDYEAEKKEQPKASETFVAQPSRNAMAPLNNTWSNIQQGEFTSTEEPATTLPSEETYEGNISAASEDEKVTTPTVGPNPSVVEANRNVSPFEQENNMFTSATPEENTNHFQSVVSQKNTEEPKNVIQEPVSEPTSVSTAKRPPFEPKEDFHPVKAKPVVEANPFQTAYASFSDSMDSKEQAISKQAQEFSDASKVDRNTMPVMQERESVPQVNPLEKVNATVPVKASQPTEFKVDSPVAEPEPQKPVHVEMVEPVSKPLTEEEIEKQKEEEYFSYRQKKQADALLKKKREKEERISSLMKYVSDVPKSYSYDLPSDVLLEEIDDSAKMEKNTASAQEKATIINRVFDEFGVKAKATSFTIGASVTRFNVETEHGEKADKIANLNSEFQRSLNGDMSVRVETVVEGRSTSGIEVGNIAPMAVAFKDMFEFIEQDHKNLLLLPIGKDISGNIVTFPLNKMPHMLVAGTTGSGKSVLIHSMIMTLIMRTYPSQCKLMLIDPKQVEFIRYQECSHLFCPVISKPESAILALKKLCEEMDRRFTVLSSYRCANLEDYEEKKKGHESQFEDMPYIVTVIDEFADLMQTGGNEVTKYVTRIAQKARACGIHLIIATQRPSKDNVPMIIKANVPCRIGLSCSSQIDSRVILDENGAETLLGKGDLLFKCPGKKSLIRAQSPFISNKDIDTVLEYVKKNAGDPNYDSNFLDLDVAPQEEEVVDTEGDLYTDIVDYVTHTGITSKSSIMRSFQVSSQKADQFIARMASECIIALGPSGKYVLGPAAHLEDFES
jgi:DNA segregation ATPase FtsK/SpoIIIE-like protein